MTSNDATLCSISVICPIFSSKLIFLIKSLIRTWMGRPGSLYSMHSDCAIRAQRETTRIFKRYTQLLSMFFCLMHPTNMIATQSTWMQLRLTQNAITHTLLLLLDLFITKRAQDKQHAEATTYTGCLKISQSKEGSLTLLSRAKNILNICASD